MVLKLPLYATTAYITTAWVQLHYVQIFLRKLSDEEHKMMLHWGTIITLPQHSERMLEIILKWETFFCKSQCMLYEIWGRQRGKYYHSTLHSLIDRKKHFGETSCLLLQDQTPWSSWRWTQQFPLKHWHQSVKTTEHCNPYGEICKFLSYNMSCKRVVPTAVLLTWVSLYKLLALCLKKQM